MSSGEDRPILSRISDRLGDLFGSRPEASRQSSGWQSTGWFQDDVQDRQVLPVHSVPGYLVMPLGTETAEPPVIQRTPAPKVSLSEPPLLELTADAPVALPAQPLSVEPASFQPPQVVAPAPNK